MERYLVEAVAVTFRAHRAREELTAPLVGFRACVEALLHLDVFHQTLVRHVVAACRHGFVLEVEAHVGAGEDVVESLIGKFADGSLYVGSVHSAYCLDLPEYERVLIFAQRYYRPFVNRFCLVGDYLFPVDEVYVAEALAPAACALGRVEREIVGCGLGIRESALGVHQHLAVMAHLAGLHVDDHELAVALPERVFHRLPEPAEVGAVHAQPVHHQFHRVVAVSVELESVDEFAQLSVDSDVEVSLLAQVLEELLVVSLAVFDKRGEYVDLAAFVFLCNEVYNLVFGVFHHRKSAYVAAGLAEARVKQTEEVVDFCSRSYRRPRIAVHCLLLDTDHGR